MVAGAASSDMGKDVMDTGNICTTMAKRSRKRLRFLSDGSLRGRFNKVRALRNGTTLEGEKKAPTRAAASKSGALAP
jgi:hypothetical protein